MPCLTGRGFTCWATESNSNKDGKWGALNYDTFEFTVPFKFDIIKPYRDGKAKAVLDGKSVVIDRNGNIVG